MHDGIAMPDELAQIIALHREMFGGMVMQADEGAPAPEGGAPAAPSFEPITSQEQLNALLGERLSRERAKYADYDDLKAKAGELDKLTEANKTELQKAQDAATALERERDAARLEALRFKVASKHGISDEDAELYLTASDEQTLTRQAEGLAKRSTAPADPNPVRLEVNNSGDPTAVAGADKDAQARAFFGL